MTNKHTAIAVLGNGGWGTTLALVLAENGMKPRLWGAFPDYSSEVRRTRVNQKFLPGFRLPASINVTSDIAEACEGAQLAVLAAPSQHVRKVLQQVRENTYFKGPYLSVAKGIETGSLKTMSQVIHEELGRVRLAVLSGPSIAREVAQRMPVAVSLASRDAALRALVRRIFSNDYFKLFETADVMGVELGGSVKNVIAIAAGISQGLGYGSNTQAALFARGVAEMARLGSAMGAKRETFMGLSGLGDLATTCLSPQSRNRSLGEAIGKGAHLKKLLGATEMVVEGVDTCRSAHALAKKYKVTMPITSAVYGVLFNGRDPRSAVQALMRVASNRELD